MDGVEYYYFLFYKNITLCKIKIQQAHICINQPYLRNKLRQGLNTTILD